MDRFICVLLVSCLVWLNVLPASSHLVVETSVNAVIGDISYYQRFGRLPTYQDDEVLRIRTHLSYVEKLLRSRVPSTVSTSLMPRRQQMLDLLHTYHQQGVFPSQDAYEGRRPNFIDEQGRLCAVGYLIAQTAGIGLAREIDKDYSYAYLPEMKSSKLAVWAEKSGLTTEELAMIQPSYADPLGRPSLDANYSLIILAMAGLQVLTAAFHLGTLIWFDPAFYEQMQLPLVLVASISLGLMVMLGVLPLAVPGLYPVSTMVPLLLAANLTWVLGLPNMLVLHYVGEEIHEQYGPLSVGMFQTPDQQVSWGLHASLSF